MLTLCCAGHRPRRSQTPLLVHRFHLRMRGLWSLGAAVLLLGLICGSGSAANDSVDPHAILQRMGKAYNGIQDYTALFLKRERIKGEMQPLEFIELRFQEPFKLYMAWQKPHAGRVLTYVEGENNNKIRVNPGGMLGFLRLSLDPTSSLVTRNAHHTVRQAGLQNLIDFLMQQYQRATQRDEMTLHFRGHEAVDGRSAYRIEFILSADKSAGYYASRGEIWVDKEYYLPTRLYIYNWDNQLYEHYEYRHLRLNPGLGPEAFRLPPAVQMHPSPAQAEESNGP